MHWTIIAIIAGLVIVAGTIYILRHRGDSTMLPFVQNASTIAKPGASGDSNKNKIIPPSKFLDHQATPTAPIVQPMQSAPLTIPPTLE